MRHGAMTFADEIADRPGETWDVLFCSDMLNLAELIGFVPDRLGRIPALVYFHENQLTYPVQVEKEWDLHFGLINLSTLRAADAVWFNSEFHRKELLGAIPQLFQKMPGQSRELSERLRVELIEKSAVHSPPFELPAVERRPGARSSSPMRIVWAARWEFDKNPDLFFEALFELDRRGRDFRVSVLGERFSREPPIFSVARERLGHRVEEWGYLPKREDYAAALARADVFVSTADHEFFGIAAIEAIASGAFPILPDRLSYPELLSGVPSRDRYLYDGSSGGLVDRLEASARRLGQRGTLVDSELDQLRESVARYRWDRAVGALDRGLAELASGD